MAWRTTNKDVEEVFKLFAKACGKRIAKSYDDVGAWRLDGNSTYGGWRIEQIVNEHGAVGHPLTELRYKSGEFVAMMHFAMRAMDAKRRR